MIAILRKKSAWAVALFALATVTVTALATAQDENEKARETFRKAVNALSEAKAWHGEVSILIEQSLGEREQNMNSSFRAAIQRPNSVMVSTAGSGASNTYVRTNDRTYALNGQWSKFMKQESEAVPVSEALTQQFPASATAVGPMSGTVILADLMEAGAADKLLADFESVKMGDPEEIDGTKTIQVIAEDAEGTRSYFIHPDTHEILQVRVNPQRPSKRLQSRTRDWRAWKCYTPST